MLEISSSSEQDNFINVTVKVECSINYIINELGDAHNVSQIVLDDQVFEVHPEESKMLNDLYQINLDMIINSGSKLKVLKDVNYKRKYV